MYSTAVFVNRALDCITLHYIHKTHSEYHIIYLHPSGCSLIALHCTALHSITSQYIAFHCIALHYTTLHCVTLHYITFTTLTTLRVNGFFYTCAWTCDSLVADETQQDGRSGV